MKIPVMYHVDKGARTNLWFWQIATIIFIGLSALLAYVAWHNAKPLQCDDVVWDKYNQIKYCEIPFNPGQQNG